MSLTDQIFDAALCELAVVSRGQNCVLAGDFNVEPTKVDCLLQEILAGLSVNLQCSWARAARFETDVTCKRDWACLGETGRDFLLECPLAAAALGRVLG